MMQCVTSFNQAKMVYLLTTSTNTIAALMYTTVQESLIKRSTICRQVITGVLKKRLRPTRRLTSFTGHLTRIFNKVLTVSAKPLKILVMKPQL
ncbi:hypothetical protein V12B01_13110 [Vibrio splendidus 12B01]|nr:hypothetical protein V12B01_13110 [Vibrio splendidus 12B01]